MPNSTTEESPTPAVEDPTSAELLQNIREAIQLENMPAAQRGAAALLEYHESIHTPLSHEAETTIAAILAASDQ